MSEHKYIWLQPECCADPDEGRHWCQDPDPVDCDDGKPWVKYVLASEAEQQLLAVRGELETERLRLAACGAAALGYFEDCKPEYRSASLEDVLRLYASLQQAQGEVKKYHAYREACEQYIGLARLYLSKGDPDKAYGFLRELCNKLDVVDGNKPTPSDKQEAGGVERDYDDEPESPYCECDLQYDEEEQAFNKCGCCGKPII